MGPFTGAFEPSPDIVPPPSTFGNGGCLALCHAALIFCSAVPGTKFVGWPLGAIGGSGHDIPFREVFLWRNWCARNRRWKPRGSVGRISLPPKRGNVPKDRLGPPLQHRSHHHRQQHLQRYHRYPKPSCPLGKHHLYQPLITHQCRDFHRQPDRHQSYDQLHQTVYQISQGRQILI